MVSNLRPHPVRVSGDAHKPGLEVASRAYPLSGEATGVVGHPRASQLDCVRLPRFVRSAAHAVLPNRHSWMPSVVLTGDPEAGTFSPEPQIHPKMEPLGPARCFIQVRACVSC
jgi:hypothetical protein